MEVYTTHFDPCTGAVSTAYGVGDPTQQHYVPNLQELSVTATVPMDDGSMTEVDLVMTAIGPIETPDGSRTIDVVPGASVTIQYNRGSSRTTTTSATINGAHPTVEISYLMRSTEIVLIVGRFQ